MKVLATGLRYTKNGLSTIDSVIINAETIEEAELYKAHLSWSWREMWRVYTKVGWPKYDETVKSVDPNVFKLPEGYHLEISLVKDEE